MTTIGRRPGPSGPGLMRREEATCRRSGASDYDHTALAPVFGIWAYAEGASVMSIKLSVGVARKVGLPGYSSVGASCGMELDLDGALVEDGPGSVRARARAAFAACAAAVDDELVRQRAIGAGPPDEATGVPGDVRPVTDADDGGAGQPM